MTYPPMPVKPQKAPRPITTDTVVNALMAVLAVATLAVSGWSLGTLLHSVGAPWLFAWAGVGVFDVPALIACLIVHQRRADPWQAAGAFAWMTLSLVSSAVVNGAHGAALGGWPVAMVLAAAPLAFDAMFSIRYRALTGLIWILFRKESFNRLRYDAWTRIAIPVDGTLMSFESGSPAAAAETVERVRTSGTRAKVAELYGSGVTDPERMLTELPAGTNPESVKRYLREIRKGETA